MHELDTIVKVNQFSDEAVSLNVSVQIQQKILEKLLGRHSKTLDANHCPNIFDESSSALKIIPYPLDT